MTDKDGAKTMKSGTLATCSTLKVDKSFVAPKIRESTKQKLRTSNRAKADTARRASTIRMG
jgi:hypothetical protein